MIQLKPMKMYDDALELLKRDHKRKADCKDCYSEYESELSTRFEKCSDLKLISIKSDSRDLDVTCVARIELVTKPKRL